MYALRSLDQTDAYAKAHRTARGIARTYSLRNTLANDGDGRD